MQGLSEIIALTKHHPTETPETSHHWQGGFSADPARVSSACQSASYLLITPQCGFPLSPAFFTSPHLTSRNPHRSYDQANKQRHAQPVTATKGKTNMSALFTTTDWLSTTSTSPDAKAPQACASCRKMKRKCDKSLPACGLCTRMDRRCDYADPPPPPPPPHQQQQYPGPTADDFAALQLKLLELESRLDHQAGPAAAVASALFSDADAATAFGAVVGSGLGPDHPGSTSAQYPPDVFLDIWAFKALNQSLPRPSVDIPAEVLELLGDSATVQRAVEAYFAGTHAWLPIVSRERIHMGAALAQGGPDLAMLFLAMRLIAAAPDDVAAPGRLLPPLPEVYGAAKRFLSLLEGAGFASLMVLQAMVLVAYFEYAHAVYPAAWLTVASCVRYADFLGLPGLRESNVTLKVPSTWTELEERLRTWWAILVLDRIICLGNGKRYLSPEPDDDMNFPVDDEVWVKKKTSPSFLFLSFFFFLPSPPSRPKKNRKRKKTDRPPGRRPHRPRGPPHRRLPASLDPVPLLLPLPRRPPRRQRRRPRPQDGLGPQQEAEPRHRRGRLPRRRPVLDGGEPAPGRRARLPRAALRAALRRRPAARLLQLPRQHRRPRPHPRGDGAPDPLRRGPRACQRRGRRAGRGAAAAVAVAAPARRPRRRRQRREPARP
ncbi:fungal specific transcription factor domain-containing protein [Colletotrichum graminicola]|nr:fungal specific transcription factor domain-containing protein [Colletotrichum graminicola]